MARYGLHFGDGAHVEHSLVVGGSATVQELHLHVQQLADLPVLQGTYVLLAAHADRARVKERAQELRAKHLQIVYDPPSQAPEPPLDAPMARALAEAEHVYVYWSQAAAQDAYVAAALALAVELGQQRHGHAVRGGYLQARRLDGTPLPLVLTGRPPTGSLSPHAHEPLFEDLQRLSHGAFDDALRALGILDHVAGPREAHHTRLHEAFELAVGLGQRQDLEAAVAERLAPSAHHRDAASAEHRHRGLVRALEARQPDVGAIPAVLQRLGVRRPQHAREWSDVVPQLDPRDHNRLVDWAHPLEELTDEPRCLARIELALLYCGLERTRLLELAIIAGVEARLDDTPLDDWIADLVRSSAKSGQLGAWLSAIATALPEEDRWALSLFDLRDRWEDSTWRRHQFLEHFTQDLNAFQSAVRNLCVALDAPPSLLVQDDNANRDVVRTAIAFNDVAPSFIDGLETHHNTVRRLWGQVMAGQFDDVRRLLVQKIFRQGVFGLNEERGDINRYRATRTIPADEAERLHGAIRRKTRAIITLLDDVDDRWATQRQELLSRT